MRGVANMGRIIQRSLLVCGIFAIISIGFPQSVFAQDAQFRDGVKAFEEGRFEDAEKSFTEVLKANPSNEDALSFRDEAGYKFWVEVLARGGRLGTLARRLLKRAESGAKKDRQSEEKMREMLKTMLETESYIEQFAMVEKLVQQHGHYTVPLLVEILGDSKEADKRVRTISYLKRLGDEGILALLELLESEKSLLQQNACIILGHIRDRRALPALKRKAETSKDGTVKKEANTALSRFEFSGKSTDAYAVLGEAYYKENPLVMVNPYKEWVVWKWRGTRLTRKIVRRYAWNDQVAEELAYDGLSVDPNDQRLWALLINVYAMQWNEVTGTLRVMRQVQDRGGDVDEELMGDLEKEKTRLKKANMVIASAGREALFGALQKALEDNNAAVAITIIEALRDIKVEAGDLPASGASQVLPLNNPGALPGKEVEITLAQTPGKAAAKGNGKTPAKDAKPAAKPAPKPAPKAEPKKEPKPAAKPRKGRGRVSQLPGKNKKGYALRGGVFPQAAKPAGAKKDAPADGGAANSGGGSALCAALVFGDRRVRFAAAMALARLNPATAFSNSDKVMENLAEAVAQSGQRVILVVERDLNTRNDMIGRLRSLGYMVYGVPSGLDAEARLRSFPAHDLVIVSSELNKNGAGDEPLEFQFVRKLKEDYRTKPIKVMVLTPAARETEMAKLVDAEESVVGVITPGVDKIVLRDKITEIFSSDEAKRDEKARADKVAENAALAIASLQDKQTLFKLERANKSLINNCTGRPNEVRIAAMKGLGAVGPKARTAALNTLVAVFKNKENATEVRVAAANAIGEVLRNQAVQGDAFQTLKASLTEDSTAIWKAAGYALGKAKLTNKQRLEVYVEQRLSEGGSGLAGND